MSPTVSETRFEQFCRETDLALVPIPTSGQQTPDYELRAQDPPILVEVKQIDPNPVDRRTPGLGDFEAIGATVGALVRQKIRAAASQLRALEKPTWPGLVVIYHNVHPIRPDTDPRWIMAAMYGQFEVRLLRSHEPGRPGQIMGRERRLGGDRTMTETTETSVSAVAVLADERLLPDGGRTDSCLVVYHNRFAANPIDVSVLRRARIFQRRFHDPNPGREFPTWVAV